MAIVLGTDFSQGSRGALTVAVEEAQARKTSLVIVHAFTPGIRIGALYDSDILDPVREVEAEMQLDDAVTLSTEWAKVARDAGVNVETIAKEGHPTDLLLDVARQEDAELIVVGRAGHGLLGSLFLGSHADSVVRKSHIPVLVVPEKK